MRAGVDAASRETLIKDSFDIAAAALPALRGPQGRGNHDGGMNQTFLKETGFLQFGSALMVERRVRCMKT